MNVMTPLAVVGGPRDHRKAAAHEAIHEVRVRTTAGVRALPGQHLEVVAVVCGGPLGFRYPSAAAFAASSPMGLAALSDS
jgi:hypothetical protein